MNRKSFFIPVSLLIAAVLLFSCGSKELLFTEGTGSVPFSCRGPYAGKTIEIYYHIPAGDVRTMPVQVVMHGMGRNADGYRNHWAKLADQYGFIVLTPFFSEEAFPEIAYQQGNVKDESGSFVSKDEMTYPIISEIFHFFKDNSLSRAKKYNIYGHSAGGQFVHRYLLFNDTPEVDLAVAANAGWYTFPTDTIDYPYGIGDSAEKIGTDVDAFYGKRMIVLLGDADTLRQSSLRQTPEADAQGLTRLERGETFFEFCKEDAARRGVPFNWEKAYAPGVGHSDGKMAPDAARVLYGRNL
ncbi:MAG: hypothetical protein ACSW72_07320 [Bacteroidales bacterium]